MLENETFDVNVAGTVSTANGTSAKLSQLTVTSSSNIVRIEKSPDKDLVIALSPSGAPGGSGSLHVTSDLARVKQLADAFSGTTAKPDPATALHSGKLDGTLAFNRAGDQPQTSIDANLALTELTVGDKLNNERLDLTTDATVPDAFDSATAKLDVKAPSRPFPSPTCNSCSVAGRARCAEGRRVGDDSQGRREGGRAGSPQALRAGQRLLLAAACARAVEGARSQAA